MLVEKLLAKVHGSPSAAITRRTVVRLHEPVSSTPQTDVVRAIAVVVTGAMYSSNSRNNCRRTAAGAAVV